MPYPARKETTFHSNLPQLASFTHLPTQIYGLTPFPVLNQKVSQLAFPVFKPSSPPSPLTLPFSTIITRSGTLSQTNPLQVPADSDDNCPSSSLLSVPPRWQNPTPTPIPMPTPITKKVHSINQRVSQRWRRSKPCSDSRTPRAAATRLFERRSLRPW